MSVRRPPRRKYLHYREAPTSFWRLVASAVAFCLVVSLASSPARAEDGAATPAGTGSTTTASAESATSAVRVKVEPATQPSPLPTDAPPVAAEAPTRDKPPIDLTEEEALSVKNVNYVENGVPQQTASWGIAPKDEATNVGTTPTLVGASNGFKPTAKSPVEFVYRIYGVCPRSADCSKPIIESEPVQGGWQVPAGILAANTTYRWMVSAANKGGSRFSFDWHEYVFATGDQLDASGKVQTDVRPQSPARQSNISTLTPDLKVDLGHAVPGTTYEYRYSVSLCKARSCTSPQLIADSGWVNSSSWTIPQGVLSWGEAYEWETHVRDNPYVGSLYDEERTFVTQVPLPAGSTFGADSQTDRIDGVSLWDRHFEHEATDADMSAAGSPLRVSRSYSSRNSRTGAFGDGWSSIFDAQVYDISAGKVVRLADGHEVPFGANSDGSFTPVGAVGVELQSCASGCTYRYKDEEGSVFEFGADGLSLVKNKDGLSTKFTRNKSGQITQIKDVNSGHLISVGWNEDKIETIDVGGAPKGTPNRWTYAYTGDLLTKACRPADTAVCVSYAYSSSSDLTSITNPGGGKSAKVTYAGSAVSQIQTTEGIKKFSAVKSGSGKVVTVTTAAGGVDRYTLDFAGRTKDITNSRGGTETWRYDLDGHTTAYKSPEDVYVSLRYDVDGRMWNKHTYYPDKTEKSVGYSYVAEGLGQGQVQYEYDAAWVYWPLSVKDASARANVEYSYDSSGRVLSVTHGRDEQPQSVEKYSYVTASEASADGGVTPKGLLKTVTDPAGSVTTFKYFADGQLATESDPSGAKVSYAYDWAGRLTSESHEADSLASQVTQYSYDQAGLLASQTSPATTDAVTGDPHQLRTSWMYDLDGRMVRETSEDLPQNVRRTTVRTLDSDGRLLKITGPDGATRERRTYDEYGRPVRISDGGGGTRALEYDGAGDLLKVTALQVDDPTGAVATHDVVLQESTYDGSGRLASQIDRSGTKRTFRYREANQLLATTVTPPSATDTNSQFKSQLARFNDNGQMTLSMEDGVTTSLQYDGLNRPILITTATGNGEYGPSVQKVSRKVDARGLLTQETLIGAEISRVQNYTYDKSGRLLSQSTGGSGSTDDTVTVKYARDAFGRVTTQKTIDSSGQSVSSQKLSWDEVNRQVATSSTDAKPRIEEIGYDAFGNQVERMSPSGARVESSFDSSDRLISITNPHRDDETVSRTSFTYNAADSLTKTTYPDGTGVASAYDDLGQIVRKREFSGKDILTESFAQHDDAGNEVKSIDANGVSVSRVFNWRGQVLSESSSSDAGPIVRKYQYSQWGMPEREVSAGGQVTSATYNALGELTSSTDPTGRLIELQRDATGRIVQQKDSYGPTQWLNYDARGNVVRLSMVDAESKKVLRSWNWSYNALDNQVQQVNPLGGVRSQEFDERGLILKSVFEDGSAATFQYDQDGNPTGYTDPNGNTTWSTYSGSGNRLTLTEPAVDGFSSNSSRRWGWTYDWAGRVIKELTPGSGSRTTEYDALGNPQRVTSVIDGASAERRFEYDKVGRLTAAATAGGGVEKFVYDDSGHVVKSTETRTGETKERASTFSYDLDGNLTKKVTSGGTEVYSWNKAGQQTSTSLPGGKKYSYSYDGASLSKISGPDGVETRTYDAVGNLVHQSLVQGSDVLVDDALSYDASGNRTKLVTSRGGSRVIDYRYDIRDRLSSWTSNGKKHAYQYDPAGNITSMDGVPQVFNDRNQLIKSGDSLVTYKPDGRRSSSNGTPYKYDAFGQLSSAGTATYEYDSLGRLTVDGDRNLTYDGMDRRPSKLGSTAVSYGPTGTVLAVGNRQALSDAHGDMTAWFDESGAFNTEVITPYGDSGKSDAPIGIQGDYRSANLVDMDSRWYDPKTASFLSRDDTVLGLQEQNRYAYGAGNPLGYTDPTGRFLFALPLIPIAIAGAEAAVTVGATVVAGAGAYVASSSMALDPSMLVALGMIKAGSMVAGQTASRAYTTQMDVSIPNSNSYALQFGSQEYAYRAASLNYKPINFGSYGLDAIDFGSYRPVAINIPNINIDLSGMNAQLGVMNAQLGGIAARIGGSATQMRGAAASIASSMAHFASSMDGISSAMVAVRQSLASIPSTRFGIDRPSWAYPEPVALQGVASAGAGLGVAAGCGMMSTSGCALALGSKGTSCAGGGQSSYALCSPAPVDGLWAAEPMAGSVSSASGVSAGGRAHAGGDCLPPRLVTDAGCEDPMEFLHRKVADYRERLSQNPDTRNSFLSEAELKAGGGRIDAINNGKSMERAVAEDPWVSEHFIHRGGAGQPDFVSRSTGEFFELTTSRWATVRAHLRRSYVDIQRLLTYDNWKY